MARLLKLTPDPTWDKDATPNLANEGFSREISSRNSSNKRKQLRRLKPDERIQVKKDYLAGKSVGALATDFGVSRQTISRVLKDEQVARRVGRLSAEQNAEIREERGSGGTADALASKWAVSTSTVKRVLRSG